MVTRRSGKRRDFDHGPLIDNVFGKPVGGNRLNEQTVGTQRSRGTRWMLIKVAVGTLLILAYLVLLICTSEIRAIRSKTRLVRLLVPGLSEDEVRSALSRRLYKRGLPRLLDHAGEMIQEPCSWADTASSPYTCSSQRHFWSIFGTNFVVLYTTFDATHKLIKVEAYVHPDFI